MYASFEFGNGAGNHQLTVTPNEETIIKSHVCVYLYVG